MDIESTKPPGLEYQLLDFRSPILGLIALSVIGLFLALEMMAPRGGNSEYRAPRWQPSSTQKSEAVQEEVATVILVDDAGRELVQLQMLEERNDVRMQSREEPAETFIVNVAGFTGEQVLALVGEINAGRRSAGLSDVIVIDSRTR